MCEKLNLHHQKQEAKLSGWDGLRLVEEGLPQGRHRKGRKLRKLSILGAHPGWLVYCLLVPDVETH